jgi:FkbM family methyltransferase
MGWKGSLKRGVDNCLRSVPLCPSLPTCIGGKIVWLPRQNWDSVYKVRKPYLYRALSDVLKRGSVFWDIGANDGLVSLFAERLVGGNGRVFSFEPAPDRFATLAANLTHARRIRAIHCGVADYDGVATAVYGAPSAVPGDNMRPETQYHSAVTFADERVYFRTIETLTANVAAPDVINIDVNGWELKVICGGHKTFANCHPTIIMGVHPSALASHGGSEGWLFRSLESHGYRSEVIDQHPSGTYTVLAR